MVYSATLSRAPIWPLWILRNDSRVVEDNAELAGLRSFDPIAVASIHERYFPELFRYARYRLGDPTTAEDLASEALVRLLEAVASGRGPKTSLRGWLVGTLANLVNDHFRQAYSRPTADLPDHLLNGDPDPSDQVADREQSQQLRQAMAVLTAEQQHVLTLRFGNGYSLEETAAIMGKNPNAIKALQFRAVTALRKQIGERTL
jgi:RNA polymerase sigma-70 factor (ECF subfamily)